MLVMLQTLLNVNTSISGHLRILKAGLSGQGQCSRLPLACKLQSWHQQRWHRGPWHDKSSLLNKQCKLDPYQTRKIIDGICRMLLAVETQCCHAPLSDRPGATQKIWVMEQCRLRCCIGVLEVLDDVGAFKHSQLFVRILHSHIQGSNTGDDGCA